MKNTTRITELLRRLEGVAKELGLNKAQIATAAGLHPNTLRGFNIDPGKGEHSDWRPNSTTIEALERVLLPPLSTANAKLMHRLELATLAKTSTQHELCVSPPSDIRKPRKARHPTRQRAPESGVPAVSGG